MIRFDRLAAWGVAVTLLAPAGLAQTGPLEFEVASVKPATPGETGGRIQFLPARFSAMNVSLTFLIQQLYQIRDFQIVGDPQWKAVIADGTNARYYIEGKAPDGATESQIREMAKALLAERFQLKMHKETREFPVYAAVPAKDGIKLQAKKDDPALPPGRTEIELVRTGWTQGTNVTVPYLMGSVANWVDRPIIDKTGFSGMFDFRLTWMMTQDTDLSPGGCPPSFAEVQKQRRMKPEPLSCESTIFAAFQEQLGIKLDPQKTPIEVLVIDHVERPSEN